MMETWVTVSAISNYSTVRSPFWLVEVVRRRGISIGRGIHGGGFIKYPKYPLLGAVCSMPSGSLGVNIKKVVRE